jgi:hypothetical protein
MEPEYKARGARMAFGRTWNLGLAAAVLALSGCKSFNLTVQASDPAVAQSVFVAVAPSDKLQGDYGDLVLPSRYEEYEFFAQFQPAGVTWQEGFKRDQSAIGGSGIDVEIDGPQVLITFPGDYVEGLSARSPVLAVIMRGKEDDWFLDTLPLLQDGSITIAISATGLTRVLN